MPSCSIKNFSVSSNLKPGERGSWTLMCHVDSGNYIGAYCALVNKAGNPGTMHITVRGNTNDIAPGKMAYISCGIKSKGDDYGVSDEDIWFDQGGSYSIEARAGYVTS